MSGPKLLIDTNVFIQLEDPRVVPEEVARLQALAAKHEAPIFVHEASIDDLSRDSDVNRRKVSLSKLAKFRRISKVRGLKQDQLEAEVGRISGPNDLADAMQLHAVKSGAVDFLITEDNGLHSRARAISLELADRVLHIAEAVDWLRRTYEPINVLLPFVEEVAAHTISPHDDIFESLREGYPGFDAWWQKSCVSNHRPCWIVTVGDALAALVVRKDETRAEAGTTSPGEKVLKICTFKVKPAYRGEKIGELLLKQILWYAQQNAYDTAYLTAFPNQKTLIAVLEFFGFQHTRTSQEGELLYEKALPRERLIHEPEVGLAAQAAKHYPRFVSTPPATPCYIPIKGEYHRILFPELADRLQGNLFEDFGIPESGDVPRSPGNTIRKVYLCRAAARLTPGDILLFYKSRTPGSAVSQALTTVGILEATSLAFSTEHLVQLAGKRSVYSRRQLDVFKATPEKPVKVLDFLLIGHLERAVTLHELQDLGVVGRSPPQSIARLNQLQFAPLKERMNFGFQV